MGPRLRQQQLLNFCDDLGTPRSPACIRCKTGIRPTLGVADNLPKTSPDIIVTEPDEIRAIQNCTSLGRQRPHERPQECCLTGTVPSNKAAELALTNKKAGVVHEGAVPIETLSSVTKPTW